MKWFLQMINNITSSPKLLNEDKPRQEKIAAIKQALEAGTYQIDNRILADSLLIDLLWEQMERLRLLSLDLLNDLTHTS
jgi:hypothetical protein